MLTLENPDWHFENPGELPRDLYFALRDLTLKICGQGQSQWIYEHFKKSYSLVSGQTYCPSSNMRFVSDDLDRDMRGASANGPLFIKALYDACEQLQQANPDIAVPDDRKLNRILRENDAGYEIRDSKLFSTNGAPPIEVPDRPPSLNEQAREHIQSSLAAADRALANGDGRQAVQEVLWLLETISTAYRGINAGAGTIDGKYFNPIIDALKRDNSNVHRTQILRWMETLHGFLSAPAGGGVRHGSDLKEGVALSLNEAKLYCNLIRSYVTYLIEEHGRLQIP